MKPDNIIPPFSTRAAELVVAIRNFIHEIDSPVGREPILSDKTVDTLANDYRRFIECATRKYIRGQAEHGGLLGDRDCFKEIGPELYDFFHYYNEAKRQREKLQKETQ